MELYNTHLPAIRIRAKVILDQKEHDRYDFFL